MSTQSVQHSSHPVKHLISVYLLFFMSGFCALVYEVVWSRMLVLVMGNTIFATTTILTVFMAGLSLGGLFWGNAVDKTHKNPLFLFGCLEGGIGISAILVSQVIWAIIPFGAWASQIAELGGLSQMTLRFLLCFTLLFFPTFLIGGTLAVVGKYVITEGNIFAQRTAGLYGINTAGSFLGAGVTGFFLIKILGHNGCLLVAALLNCIGGIFAVWMSASSKTSAASQKNLPGKQRKAKGKTFHSDGKGNTSNPVWPLDIRFLRNSLSDFMDQIISSGHR